MDCASSEETLNLESIQASYTVEGEVFGEEIGDVVCGLTAKFGRGDV